jgi:hypothetical protein
VKHASLSGGSGCARIRETRRGAGWYPVAVIPSGWSPVHRSDGEHVGYLVPDGSAGLVLPVTLVGAAVGPSVEPAAATALLRTRGLAVLDRRWWCRLPAVLPRGVLPAGDPPPDWDWRPVVLLEVSAAGCRVRPEMPAPEERPAQAALPVPVGNLLRAEAP